MTFWPPDWEWIFAIVAFIAASLAVQGFRELLVLSVLTAMLILPIKWLGVAAGFAVFGEPAFVYETLEKGFRIRGHAATAPLTAIILASLIMIAAREVMVRPVRNIAASPSYERQIQKAHWHHKVDSVPLGSNVRKRGCRKVMRTLEPGH